MCTRAGQYLGLEYSEPYLEDLGENMGKYGENMKKLYVLEEEKINQPFSAIFIFHFISVILGKI